ncbi:hypothetical protein AJ79_06804 [Helicocarpus griseus UAMH5409]|uniref:Tf2-1-like SH3-like domain-containing protein n=1 Tax=Helicocarpus griseus UAMH5409 TaxID=1447875 RepID=A0A2B7X9W9_9EURO|nr:hypothetical protein AJ79_06804 [Helicocarpus griseus UAMH5409]
MPTGDEVMIKGIGNGVDSSQPFITADIPFISKKGQKFMIAGELHIVPHLGCNAIIANDVLYPAAAVIDVARQLITVGDKVFIRLAKKGEKGYTSKGQSKLSPIKIGPYVVIEEISQLAFRLNLPPQWKIHPVISVLHLEKEDPAIREAATDLIDPETVPSEDGRIAIS